VLVSHHAAYHANPARKGGLIFCEGNNAIFLPATHSKQYNMDGWIPKDLLYKTGQLYTYTAITDIMF